MQSNWYNRQNHLETAFSAKYLEGRTQLCLAPDSAAYIRYCAENVFMELARNTLRLLSALPGVSALI